MMRTDGWIQNCSKNKRNSPKKTTCLFCTIMHFYDTQRTAVLYSDCSLQMGQLGPKINLGTLTMIGDDFPGVWGPSSYLESQIKMSVLPVLFTVFFKIFVCYFISPWIGKNREKYGVGLGQTPPPSLGIFTFFTMFLPFYKPLNWKKTEKVKLKCQFCLSFLPFFIGPRSDHSLLMSLTH